MIEDLRLKKLNKYLESDAVERPHHLSVHRVLNQLTMGNGQSIFYPDNPSRRTRADQLANDCNIYVASWNAKRADLERELGPYKEKLDKVLAAFGCQTVDDLDRLVQQRATGQALADWNKMKDVYDKTQL